MENIEIHKTSVVFHNLKTYDFCLITQELGKSNFKINDIPSVLERSISFTVNNKLSFVNRFYFLSSSLDSLVANLGKDDFKYLSQEFNSDILDLVKQKGDYMSSFKKFKERLPSKEKFYSSMTNKEISDKEHKHVRFEIETMKVIATCT